MNTRLEFTTEDADRLLGLADQFLDDWAEDAVQGGERDLLYEKRRDEWTAICPLLEAAPALPKACEACLLREDVANDDRGGMLRAAVEQATNR